MNQGGIFAIMQCQLLLRGLPFRISKNDLFEWLMTQGLDCQRYENISFCYTQKLTFNGRVIVRMEPDANKTIKAANSIHMTKWNDRYIEAFPSILPDNQFYVRKEREEKVHK